MNEYLIYHIRYGKKCLMMMFGGYLHIILLPFMGIFLINESAGHILNLGSSCKAQPIKFQYPESKIAQYIKCWLLISNKKTSWQLLSLKHRYCRLKNLQFLNKFKNLCIKDQWNIGSPPSYHHQMVCSRTQKHFNFTTDSLLLLKN